MGFCSFERDDVFLRAVHRSWRLLDWAMAGGKSRGVSGGSSKKKKKGKPFSKDPARLAAVHATLSRWASVKPSSDPLLLRMDLHTHSTCSKCPPLRLKFIFINSHRGCLL